MLPSTFMATNITGKPVIGSVTKLPLSMNPCNVISPCFVLIRSGTILSLMRLCLMSERIYRGMTAHNKPPIKAARIGTVPMSVPFLDTEPPSISVRNVSNPPSRNAEMNTHINADR